MADIIFNKDEDAIAHVRRRADEGDPRHRLALEIHDLSALLKQAGSVK